MAQSQIGRDGQYRMVIESKYKKLGKTRSDAKILAVLGVRCHHFRNLILLTAHTCSKALFENFSRRDCRLHCHSGVIARFKMHTCQATSTYGVPPLNWMQGFHGIIKLVLASIGPVAFGELPNENRLGRYCL